jgi:transposase
MTDELLALAGEEISAEDWERTPASVKRLVMALASEVAGLKQRVLVLEEENRLLREQLAGNSQNSSRPPSSDTLAGTGGAGTASARISKRPSGKKRGAQRGHKGHERKLVPVEQCQQVVDHYPEQCRRCGAELFGSDPRPYRHQLVELPEVVPYVEEHRLHRLKCAACGDKTRAKLPAEVSASGYGPRLVATVALLGGMYRASERLTQMALADLFGVVLSLGTVNALRQEASEAVACAVDEAQAYVKEQAVVGADETGFKQGNADGNNPTARKAWLWVAVTALVTVFQVSLSRGKEAAQALLGVGFAGVLGTDRWGAYNWLPVEQRQLCWAHLKREFQKLAERDGESGHIGEALLAETRKLFELWYRVRDGTLSRVAFQAEVEVVRAFVKAQLTKGASYPVKRGEKTLRAKTARTCQALLKLEPALWLFVYQEGIEPTNNAAERALRPAVLWRKLSFGSQSAAGSLFVARMLTVVTTLRQQDRNVLAYLTEACAAARQGKAAPSLLPQRAELEDQLPAAA